MTDKPPAPVQVTNPEPISVNVTNPNPIAVADTTAETTAKTVATKASVDARVLTAAGQRSVSNIWERTQQLIAIAVVGASLTVAMFKAMFASLQGQESTEAGVAFVFLASVANLVIGFYFGRTNHQRVGSSGDEISGR